jgi:hypothetical protein
MPGAGWAGATRRAVAGPSAQGTHALRRVREALPGGHALPEPVWRSRHGRLVALLWLHVPALVAVGVAFGGLTLGSAAGHVAPVAVLAVLARDLPGRRLRSATAAVGLVTCSALLVHMLDGLIEAHFHFFVVVAVLALYEDWLAYGIVLLYLVLHHGVLGAMTPYRVFDHPGAEEGVEALRWAGVHALFLGAAAVANVVLWRLNEASRLCARAEAERRVRAEATAQTLVSGLIPERLPAPAGVRVGARYLPGDGWIGGDWYDVIELGRGCVGVSLGDVAGHGIAAAALTSRLRHALRAYAEDGHGPAAVMERLERAVDDRPATAVYAEVEPATGRLRFSSAGHLPPLVCEPGGRARFLDGGLSVPLAGLGVPHEETSAELPPGAALVLYSDGLVERRGEPLDLALERLRRAVEELGPDPDLLCAELPKRLLPAGRAPDDDVAIVAIRACPDPMPRLPCAGERGAPEGRW